MWNFTAVAKVTLTFKSSAMKSYIPFLSLLILFTSCTTAYKSGQTPDDVYFSPERPQEAYVRIEKQEESNRYDEADYRDDRYLRMRVRNRRWSTLEDDYFYYSYRPVYYGNPYFYNNPWNSHLYWNHLYNPYYNNVVIINQKSPTYKGPRTFNMNVFNNPGATSTTNPKGIRVTSPSGNKARSSSGSGGILREIFGGSGNASSSSSSGSSNAGSPKNSGSGNSSSGSSGTGSSGGSKAPVRKF